MGASQRAKGYRGEAEAVTCCNAHPMLYAERTAGMQAGSHPHGDVTCEVYCRDLGGTYHLCTLAIEVKRRAKPLKGIQAWRDQAEAAAGGGTRAALIERYDGDTDPWISMRMSTFKRCIGDPTWRESEE